MAYYIYLVIYHFCFSHPPSSYRALTMPGTVTGVRDTADKTGSGLGLPGAEVLAGR